MDVCGFASTKLPAEAYMLALHSPRIRRVTPIRLMMDRECYMFCFLEDLMIMAFVDGLP